MAPQAVGTLASLAKDYVSYFKAILARTLFGTHAVVAVWRTTVLMGVAYWALGFGVLCLCVEYVITMWVNMGEEWPWISPSTLCYLATVCSSLWVQKLQSLGHITGTNGSTLATLPSTSMELDFSASDWLLLTEQTMMVTIILSRWLLPKGEMTHTALSSLLLLYLGLSADILDFSTIFNEPKVAKDETFCYVLLVIWTGSLIQFFLVLTATKKAQEEEVSLKSIICSSEVWQILVQVGLQDLPFLIIRITLMLIYQVFNYTIIFFVCKNTLVICLEVNHMIGLCLEQRAKLKRRQARLQALKKKLRHAAKTSFALTRKNPFSLRGGKPGGQPGNGESKSRRNDAFSLAGAAFAAKGSEGKTADDLGRAEGGSPMAGLDVKLLRNSSQASKASSDSYATAAEGSSTRSTSIGSSYLTKDNISSVSLEVTRFDNLSNSSSTTANKKSGPITIRTMADINITGSGSKLPETRRIKAEESMRRGTPPLGHFLHSSSAFSFSTAKTSTPDNTPGLRHGTGQEKGGPFSPAVSPRDVSTIFDIANNDNVF